LGVTVMPGISISHQPQHNMVQLHELSITEVVSVIINHPSVDMASTLTIAEQVVYNENIYASTVGDSCHTNKKYPSSLQPLIRHLTDKIIITIIILFIPFT